MLYEVVKYIEPESIVCLEFVCRTFKDKLRNIPSAFCRMLEEIPNLIGKPKAFDECKEMLRKGKCVISFSFDRLEIYSIRLNKYERIPIVGLE